MKSLGFPLAISFLLHLGNSLVIKQKHPSHLHFKLSLQYITSETLLAMWELNYLIKINFWNKALNKILGYTCSRNSNFLNISSIRILSLYFTLFCHNNTLIIHYRLVIIQTEYTMRAQTHHLAVSQALLMTHSFDIFHLREEKEKGAGGLKVRKENPLVKVIKDNIIKIKFFLLVWKKCTKFALFQNHGHYSPFSE